MNRKLYRAAAHRFGPGKTHVIREGGTHTVCGTELAGCPGRAVQPTSDDDIGDCLRCRKGIESELRRAEWQAEYAEQQERLRREREQESAKWWRRYTLYLEHDPGWKRRRALVLKRSGGMCEGCGEKPATQVHHTDYRTYNAIGREMLWELRAICDECHAAITPDHSQRTDIPPVTAESFLS